MTQANFKDYADRELNKCKRYKKLWKNTSNDRLRQWAFIEWCVKGFQLQQIHIYSKGKLPPYNYYSMNEAVGYF